MAQNAVLYGNITLSQLSHFIVEICGKDALISMGCITDTVSVKTTYEKVLKSLVL